ncbi:MAG TPA: carboxyl transferase domain-containing protein, partial [Mycobacteriales bacterium]|nr:carboxyl transferase domain-containing protein [Mycobacteriales bacterium]
ESVVAGTARVDGHDAVLVLSQFGVFGGSMGEVHGARVARAMATAAELRVPLVAALASGGARMQEGVVSLLQMTRTALASVDLRAAGIPQIALLRTPTTGGVFASYASLADVILAERGATVGFAGPRVVEAMTGEQVDGRSHTAESALRAGLVDGVLDRRDIRATIGRWVALLGPADRCGPLPRRAPPPEPDRTAAQPWDLVQRARRADRPRAGAYVRALVRDLAELHGDRAGSDDPALLAGVGRIGGRTVAVLGLTGAAPAPGAFRLATRTAALASRMGLPLVTLIDTPGADASPNSENGGVAAAIAETTAGIVSVPGPTVAVIIGQGGSGGALAFAGCDRVLMQEDAVMTVIAPESAAAILHRDVSRAREVAGQIGLAAGSLADLGVVDRVLPGPTVVSPDAAVAATRDAVIAALGELDEQPGRLAARRRRYRG